MMQSVKRGMSTLSKLTMPLWSATGEMGLGRFVQPQLRSLSSLGMVGGSQAQNKNGLFRQQQQQQGKFAIGGARAAHDQRTNKGDEELLGFLSEEIATEKKMQRTTTLPSSIDGFQVKLEKAEVTLTKKDGSEEITISANVNHSVDADFAEEQQVQQKPAGKEGENEMRSRPNFDVEIKKGDSVISFTCSFINTTPEDGSEEYNDIFAIDEVCMYNKDWEEKEYSVAGDILDGYLYDLFMNMLEERGITNDVIDKFSDLCTDYEHSLYVDLLVKLQQFLEKK